MTSKSRSRSIIVDIIIYVTSNKFALKTFNHFVYDQEISSS